MIKKMLLSLEKYIHENFELNVNQEQQNADCKCCTLQICCTPCTSCNCRKNAIQAKPHVITHQGAIESAKRCPRCGQRNQLYYRNASARDGLQSWCKQCQLDYQKGKTAETSGITPVISPEVIYPEMDITLYQQMASASYSTDTTPLPPGEPDPQPEPDFNPLEIPDLTGAGELAANVAVEVTGYVTGIPGLGLGLTMLKMIGDSGNDR